jgi:hypothetical protein
VEPRAPRGFLCTFIKNAVIEFKSNWLILTYLIDFVNVASTGLANLKTNAPNLKNKIGHCPGTFMLRRDQVPRRPMIQFGEGRNLRRLMGPQPSQ